MPDQFDTYQKGPNFPVDSIVDVVTNDATDLVDTCRGIYIDVAGTVKITTPRGQAVTFNNLAVGVVHPIRARRIWATGTTATGIKALN